MKCNKVTDTERYINLSEVENVPHSVLFPVVSEVIKEKNLEEVNRLSKIITPKDSFYTRYGKRILDATGASIAITITAPINIILGVLTYFDVGHPIFFRQRRVGKDGVVFCILKFRNMTNERNAKGDLLPPMERVTKLGKFVRRTSLDELLNFISILKGDMSIIGPRPLLEEYADRYSERHKCRHAVRPGLECPLIKPSATRETWADWFENDLYYVETVSLLTDVKMIISLIKLAFDKNETSERAGAIRGSFLGYEKDGRSIDSMMVPREYYEEALKRIKKNEDQKN